MLTHNERLRAIFRIRYDQLPPQSFTESNCSGCGKVNRLTRYNLKSFCAYCLPNAITARLGFTLIRGEKKWVRN